ncbi:MAG TPA: hypothetical protein VD861_15295 [Pyrinomonadaceae bacterium]|nr:hypothetical protein [Pyrinomonadaceae bacterium]
MRITFKRFACLGLLLVLCVAAVVAFSGALHARAGGGGDAPAVKAPHAVAAHPAATACPPVNLSSVNLARNPSFELVGPNGSPTSWQPGNPVPPPSAARFWQMHTNGPAGAQVASALRPTNVPGPGGARMLHFRAGGSEGGIFQRLQPSPPKLMFSAWVYVRRGQVALQAHQFGAGQPVAWSTKLNQWEQLRVCTDGTAPTGFFSIYNQTPTGGEFFVDRVEIRETP